MSQIINLNKVRKAKARAAAEQQAAVNRVLHGRTKLEKQLQREANKAAAAKLDGHRLEPAPPKPEC